MALEPSPHDPAGVSPGSLLSKYRLVEQIGAGGMGVIYRALDTRLDRFVALKVIGHVADPARRQRFVKEARAAATFNHPNIVTIYEVDADRGVDFIAMELLSGESLAQRIRPGGLPVKDVLDYAEPMASALESAHAAGVVHRDIKPTNVMVTDGGQVKVLDFGVAKLLSHDDPDAATMARTDATGVGAVLGSFGYMSPEQAQGLPVSAKSDVYSFGVVLHELLTGQRPRFAGPQSRPAPSTGTGSARGVALEAASVFALIDACLALNPDQRPPMAEVRRRLAAIRRDVLHDRWSLLGRPAVTFGLLSLVAAAALAGGYWWLSGREARAARARMPEILAAAEKRDMDAFFRDARTVVSVFPDDLHLRNLWINNTMEASFDSRPSDAEVWIKGYEAVDRDWVPIGRTPVVGARVPFAPVRVRIAKAGYEPIEAPLNPFGAVYGLDPRGSVPDGMVRVSKSAVALPGSPLNLPDFWIDKFEVTNRQFQAFVDAGGYRREEFWTQPVVEHGRTIPWSEAITRFRDRTGRPGPSTWELGRHANSAADLPVSGVSWYEAAAYAAFAGKSLPTFVQWRAAAGLEGFARNFGQVLTLSNFDGEGPAAVGRHQALGASGAYDMAGNVKEWCWNEFAGGHLILGGAWNEPTYMFNSVDAKPADERSAEYGFRLVKNIEPQPPDSYQKYQPPEERDYTKETPVNDETFAVLRNLYAYEPAALDTKLERVEETPDWRRETLTITAPYNDERIIVYLYLPRGKPPYHPVIFAAGGDANILTSSRELRLTESEFVVRSGRALVYPIFKGTYERSIRAGGRNAMRDGVVQRGKDLRRVVDLIESRPDLDRHRIGYYGLSSGAFIGVVGIAIEPRIRASVLAGGGLATSPVDPEFDALHFAPRVTIPTLMINGTSDFNFPAETSQKPLFRLLGTPAAHKRHVQLEGGHIPNDLNDLIRHALDWFDRYLGPIN